MHVPENANLLDNVGLNCTIKEGWNTAKQYLLDHNLISNQEMNEIRDVEVIKVTEQSLDVTGAQTTLQQSISDTSMSSTGILITSPSIFQATV